MRTWAAFLDPDNKHAELVTTLALEIFDGLAREGILPESEPARRILQAAAVMHDVGRAKSSGHRKRGYRMIRNLKPPVGWSDEYLQCVAIVAHYHRGGLPPSNHPIFAGLPAQRRSELMPLAGVLRLANALDDAHDQRISNAMVERRDGVADDLRARTHCRDQPVWRATGAGALSAGGVHQDADFASASSCAAKAAARSQRLAVC